MKPLPENERRIQLLDAIINARGVCADRELAARARDMAGASATQSTPRSQTSLTGIITSVDQVAPDPDLRQRSAVTP